MHIIKKTLLNISELPAQSKWFALLIAFLAPLSSIIYVMLILLLVDAITSIYAQVKIEIKDVKGFAERVVKGFQVIESSKLRRTIEKMFFYVMMIVVFYLVDVVLFRITPSEESIIAGLSLTNISASLIALVELWSIASNVSKITGNDVFLRVLKKFKKRNDYEETNP